MCVGGGVGGGVWGGGSVGGLWSTWLKASISVTNLAKLSYHFIGSSNQFGHKKYGREICWQIYTFQIYNLTMFLTSGGNMV